MRTLKERKFTREEIIFFSSIFCLEFFTFFSFQYVIETYNSATARSACVNAAEIAMSNAMETVVLSGQTTCQYAPNTVEYINDACCSNGVAVCFLYEVLFEIFLFSLKIFC